MLVEMQKALDSIRTQGFSLKWQFAYMCTISQPRGPFRRNKTKNKLCWLLVLALRA